MICKTGVGYLFDCYRSYLEGERNNVILIVGEISYIRLKNDQLNYVYV
jgi:hypothetical protein